MAFFSHAISPGTTTVVQFRDVDHYAADLLQESDTQWFGGEDDEVKPNALHEFRVPAGVVITYIPEGAVRLLKPLRIAVEEYPDSEFIAHWVGPKRPVDTYAQYFGYGQSPDKAIEDLLSDLGNNLASLVGMPREKLHESAQSELNVLLDYMRLERADG